MSEDLRLIKDLFPLTEKGTEPVIQVVRAILAQSGIVKFTVDARKDVIDCWRLVTPEEASERGTTFEEALRSATMEEYVPEEQDALTQIFEIFEIIEDAGCVPTQVISGRGPVELRKWIPLSRKAKSVFGVPLLFGEGVPSDVLVVCGARDWGATAEDIEYAVKVTLP